MTTIFLIRHSEPLKSTVIINEEIPLSSNGELKAKKLADLEELRDIDLIYSSEYKRAISTARYIAVKNDLLLNNLIQKGNLDIIFENDIVLTDNQINLLETRMKTNNYNLITL